MRIKKLLIAGALMLTAVGCVSAYTIYADTLNNNTDKQVSATTEGKSTTETTKNATEQKNNKKNAVKEDSKDTTNDVSATTEEEKNTENSTADDTDDADYTEPEYPDDADETCDHVWAEKTIAYDEENGYHWTTYCEKCGTVKTEPATEEDYERLDPATKVKEEDIEYVDDDSAEVVEESTEAATEN